MAGGRAAFDVSSSGLLPAGHGAGGCGDARPWRPTNYRRKPLRFPKPQVVGYQVGVEASGGL